MLRLAGKSTLVKPVHNAKAPTPIVVTVSGMFTDLKLPAAATRVNPSFVYMILSTALYLVFLLSTVRLVKPVQPAKAASPIVVRFAGKLILVKPVHWKKAASPIVVRLVQADRSKLVKPVQPEKA